MAIQQMNSLLLSRKECPTLGSEYATQITIEKAMQDVSFRQFCFKRDKEKIKKREKLEVDPTKPPMVIAFILKLINDASMWVKNDWTADIKMMFATRIYYDYPNMRFDELTYYFNKGITGAYGSQEYGNMTYAHLVHWITSGMAETADYFVNIHNNEEKIKNHKETNQVLINAIGSRFKHLRKSIEKIERKSEKNVRISFPEWKKLKQHAKENKAESK